MTRPTENRNPATAGIDLLPATEAIELIVAEDANGVAAVQRAAADLGRAVAATRSRLETGGRLHYFGAGASGRLAVLDATELTPTYGAESGLVTAHFPGGVEALIDSTHDFEDADELGAHDATSVGAADAVIGLTASGTTPYVAGALRAAARAGALTILFTCNPASNIPADLLVVLDTGPEAITGSTRLKAGTATKVALNAFSSALMIGMGRTYSHFMTGMSVSNDKLRERAVQLLSDAACVTPAEARAAYESSDGDTAVALTALLTGVGIPAARAALAEGASVREAVAAIGAAR